MSCNRWISYLGGSLLLFFLLSGKSPAQNSLEIWEQKARSTYGQDPDSSRWYAEQVLQHAQKLQNAEKVAWAYNWKAITYLSQGQADSVSLYLHRCIQYCEKHHIDKIAGMARLNRVINANNQGDYETGIELGMQALEQFEKNGDSLGMAHAYYNTGTSYHRLERMEAASDFFYKALPIYLSKGSLLNRANTYNAIGTIWRYKENPDSALYFFQAALQEKISVGADAYCGSEYSNIAEVQETQGDSALAQLNYGRAFAAYTARGDQRGAALLAGNLSRFKFSEAQWDSAVYYGELSLEYADTTDDRFLLSRSHIRLAKAYEALGNYPKAYYHDQLFDSLDRLISSTEVQKNIDQLHIQYQTEKREKELAEEKVASQRKTFLLMGSGGGILALLIAFALWYRSEREKKKRLLAQSRIQLESERNRISMDLHDHLGAELSIISSQLDIHSFKVDDPTLGKSLEQLAEQSREANAQLRETIWSVRNTEVSLEQFALKVREFSDRILKDSPIQFQVEIKGQKVLGPALALDLFRVVQEAINNAFKYSGGKHIRMQLRVDGGSLHLTIKDDGVGFSQDQITPGHGLSNMRERLKPYGAQVEIHADSGTRISIFLPLA